MPDDDYADRLEQLDEHGRAYLYAHRAVTVTQLHPDGSATTRMWAVPADVADQVATLLGRPHEETVVPRGSAGDLYAIQRGLPTLRDDTPLGGR